MATGANVRFRSLLAGESFATAQYYFVKLSAAGVDGVTCSSAGEHAFGVSQNDPADNGELLVAAIVDGGKSKIYLGEAVTDGAALTTDGDGKAILADTSTHRILGYAAKDGAINTIGEINLAYNGAVA